MALLFLLMGTRAPRKPLASLSSLEKGFFEEIRPVRRPVIDLWKFMINELLV